MGEGIAHIVSPASAVWCGWTMLALLICGILSELFQPGVISQVKSSLLSQRERIYKESPNNFMGQLMISLFRIGVLSMAVYVCCEPTGYFGFTGFWVIFGIVLATVFVKMFCNRWMDITFRLSRRFGNAYEHYGNIFTMCAMTLYPVVLVLLQYGYPEVNRWVIGSIVSVFIAIWFYCAFRQFVNSPRAILYLLVYAGTVEVLPWILLYTISNQTLSHI